MNRLFFAPVSSGSLYDNFYRTVVQGVPMGELPNSFPFYSKQEAIVRLWGIRDAKKSTYEKTSKGDVVCFYKEGDIIGYGAVKGTFLNSELADKLWGKMQKKNTSEIYGWPNVIALEDFRCCEIPFSEFIRLGNYSDKFSIRGYLEFNTLGTQKILSTNDSIINFFKSFHQVANEN
jgi:hypothetical protein